MKKLLLLAAVAMAFGASAQTLTLNWKHDVANALPGGDCRQAVGLGGKIYVNNKSDKKVYIVSQDGVEAQTLSGGGNTAINIDEAGNLVISDAAFPNTWPTEVASIKVVNPTTLQEANYTVPAEALGSMGRCDVLGQALGNLLETGTLALQGKGSTAFTIVNIAEGKVDLDYSYLATTGDVTIAGDNQAISSLYTVGDGDIKLLFRLRNGNPMFFIPDGENFALEKEYKLLHRGNASGCDYFVLNGKPYYVQNTTIGTANYLDGFAVWDLSAEPDADGFIAPVAEVDAKVSVKPNGNNYNNQLYAEVVNDYEAKIYQYYADGFCAQYTFSLPQEGTGISDVTAKKAEVKKVIENGQIYIINGDAKYNVMGAQVK